MKKILIICSTVLICWTNYSFAQNSDNKPTEDNIEEKEEEKKEEKPPSVSTTYSLKVQDDTPKAINDSINLIIAKDSVYCPYYNVLANKKTVYTFSVKVELPDTLMIISKEFQSSLTKAEEKIRTLEEANQKLKTFKLYLLFALAFLFILLMAAGGHYIFISRKRKKKNKKALAEATNELQEAKEKLEKQEKKLGEIKNLETQLKGKDVEISELKKEIEELKAKLPLSPPISSSAPPPPRPLSLYADAIIDGRFYRVEEQPNEDTVFELELSKAEDREATIVIYPPAHRRVIANPSFLEGCEKQVIGSTTVTMRRNGKAQKDDMGQWAITTPPKVEIS